jgi:hypothetical protein
MTTQQTEDDQADQYITPEEQIDTNDVSPEDRRREYAQQEGREVDSVPLPSDDGDDADDEDDREA